MLGEVCPMENAPISTTKNTLRDTQLSVSRTDPLFQTLHCASRGKIITNPCLYVSTHCEHSSDGVLVSYDEGTSIPEGQSVRQIDHQEGEAHGDVRRNGLLYSHVLSIHQVLIISVVQHTQASAQWRGLNIN